jgi:hypothetical protein
MPYLRAVDIDDRLVDELWEKVSQIGSFYSIGDGVSKETFRKVLFHSDAVFRGPNVIIRLEAKPEYIELHPIVFGHSLFRHAKEALLEVSELRDRLFAGKPIYCIIPSEMNGTKHLALKAGMARIGDVMRPLSGVEIPCEVFLWR